MENGKKKGALELMYDDLHAQGYFQSPNYEDFKKKFLAPGDAGYKLRKSVYDDLHSQGYLQSPTYEDFAERVGYRKKQKPQQTPAAKPQGTAASKNTQQAVGVGQQVFGGGKATQKSDFVQRLESQKAESDRAAYEYGRNIANTMAPVKMKPTQVTTKYTDGNGKVVRTDTQDVYPLMTKEMAQDEINKAQMDAMRAIEKVDFAGALNDAKEYAFKLEMAIDPGKLKRISDPDYYTGGGLEELKMMDQYMKEAGTSNSNVASDYSNAKAAESLLRDADFLKRAAAQSQSTSGVGGWFKDTGFGIKEKALNPDTWSFGLSDLNTYSSLLSVTKKADRGEKLRESEKRLLQAFATQSAAASYYGDKVGSGVTAGGVTAEAIPFMIEMAVNPGAGIGSALGKTALKKLGVKTLTELVKKSAKGLLKKGARKQALEELSKGVLTRVGGDLLAGATMSATTGLPGVVGDAKRRMTGNAKFEIGADGNVAYTGREGGTDNVLEAYGTAFAARTIQNQSEMAGAYFGPALGVAGKTLAKGLRKMRLGGVVDFMNTIGRTNAVKMIDRFFEKTQWHGTIGEYAEEVVGNFENVLIGENTLDTDPETGVFNLKQNIETFKSVALMGGFMSSVHTATGAFSYANAKRRLNRSEYLASEALGDRWSGIRDIINNSTDENASANLTQILQDPNLSAEQKKAVTEYVKRKDMLRGVLYGEEAKKKEDAERQAAERASQINVGSDGQTVTETNANGDVIHEEKLEDEDEAQAKVNERKLQRSEEDMKRDLATAREYSQRKADGSEELDGTELPNTVRSAIMQGVISSLGFEEGSAEYEAAMRNITTEGTMENEMYLEALAKYDPVEDAYNSVAAENESDEEEIKRAMNTDPVKRTERQQALVAAVAARLHEFAYPKGELHAEQSFTDGATQADLDGAGTDEADTEALSRVREEVKDAENALNEARKKNREFDEYVKQTVESDKPVSQEELIANMEGRFTDEEKAVLADYINAQSRMSGYLDFTNKRIQQDAERETAKRSFKGKLNGDQTGNIVRVTDGENTYFLVGGDIQVDDEGRIISAGAANAISVVDENGNPVPLGVDASLRVEVGESLDEFTAGEINRRQIETTQMMGFEETPPEGEEGAPGTQQEGGATQQGGQQGGTQQQGGNTQGGTQQGSEDGNSGNTGLPGENGNGNGNENGGEGGANIPVNDKGRKMYHLGVDIDAAIDDILNEADEEERDPAKLADRRIKTAQRKLDELNKSKKREAKQYDAQDFDDDEYDDVKAARKGEELPYGTEVGKYAEERLEHEAVINYYNQLKNRWTERRLESGNTGGNGTNGGTVVNGGGNGGDGGGNENVPDWTVDKASDARARGFRMENGHRIDRQAPIEKKAEGKEVDVKFDSQETPKKGKITVVDAGSLIPSHVNGQRNVRFFITEAQPKERTDAASELASTSIAQNVNPEEITGGVTAYTGSPVVNSRGEVIQGNNRTIGLQKMWGDSQYAMSQAQYKQYLMDHAEEFGLDRGQIEAMEHPVMVRMVDVDDEEAIRLGQKTAANTESGGKERIDAQRAIQGMGEQLRVFMELLFQGEQEGQTLSALIVENGLKVLQWMNRSDIHKPFITQTQYESALDKNGNLTDEAKTDLKKIVENTLFKDAPDRLKDMFYMMPVKAQNAILSTFFRDGKSEDADRILKDIQNAIEAFAVVSGASEEFRNAKDVNAARVAVKDVQKQTSMFGNTGTVLEKFDNFALELAILFKGAKQNTIRDYFNMYYDAVQGTGQGDLFGGEPVRKTKAEAVREIYGVDINGNNNENNNENEKDNGQEGSNALEDSGDNGTGGEPGNAGESGNGKPTEGGTGPAVGGGRTGSDGKGSEGEVRDYDNLSTVELLESLKTVDGDEYYRRVTEIARRGASGQHILDGSLKNVGVPFANADERGGFKNFVHAAATVIALDTARSRGEVFDLETGREAHKSAGVHVDADARNKQEGLVPYGISEETERETARRIAEWARRNGLFFDDETIEEHWPTQGLIGNGNNVEYDVLLTADGKSVIKKTNIDGIKTVDGENLPGCILYKLLELAYENIAFGENPRSLIAVLEGCYLDGGDVRFAFSQRYITGQTVEEKFGKDWQAMQEYIDGKMRELGYSMYIRKEEDELFGEVERHYYAKGGILVADVNAANVIIDDSGKAHVIDCWAMPIPANLEQEYESVNYHDGGVEEYLASHPLTEEQIMADTEATEDEKLNAIDFLKGEDDSAISRFYYDSIYNRAQKNAVGKIKDIAQQGKKLATKPKEKSESKSEPQWQYNFHYDKATGHVSISREDVSGPIPIVDGRWHLNANSLAEMRAILENPKNNLGELLEEVGAELHNAEVGEELRRKESDPMAALEQAAGKFREEQERKAQDQKDIDDALKEFDDFLNDAKGSNLLDKFMRKGLEGNDKAQSNLLDAFTLTNEAQRKFLGDLLRLASKVGYAYIKSGVHDAQAWSKKMSETIGAKLKDVLGWDDAIVGEFVDEVWQQKYTVDGQRKRLSEHADRLKNDKGTGTTVNEHKTENNEAENVVSSQQKPASELEGDSAAYQERQQKIDKLTGKIHESLDDLVSWDDKAEPLSTYKKMAEEAGLKDLSETDLQELIETEIVKLAREYAQNEKWTDEQKFKYIVALYEKQPSLNARDNDRMNLQQYSTPAPMAFVMGQFLTAGKEKPIKTWGLEPSAGNGMLTIGLPKERMHVNDIDEMRLSNLQKQGFGKVTSQDGTQPFEAKAYDVVVTNPPFGNTSAKDYDGWRITGLEQQMAINALESMTDDGRAAIIIGGNTEYAQNGTIKGKDKAFLNYLYQHYNVVDVINMDGHALYSRQGTGYPVRMILINGRRAADAPVRFAPVIQKARAERVKSYEELYKRVNDDILQDNNNSGNRPSGAVVASSDNNNGQASGQGNAQSSGGHAGDVHQEPVRVVRPEGGGLRHKLGDNGGERVERPGDTPATQSSTGQGTDGAGNGVVRGGTSSNGSSQLGLEGNAGNANGEGGTGGGRNGESVSERPDGRTETLRESTSRRLDEGEHKRELGEEKVPYRKQSGNPFDLQSKMPAEQAEVVKKALEKIGDVDEFLVNELGYSSKEELYDALAAEQIDSVALAIRQMQNGDAFIIGDQTGVGKGRQGAALIRWAVKQGKAPVYFTKTPDLFSGVYRDLKDIHSSGLRPFILASDEKGRITERQNGKDVVIYDLPSKKEVERVIDYINKNGKLPPEYDYVVTTYSQISGGTMVYENGQKKERTFKAGKSARTQDINAQKKRDAIENLAASSIVLMDESHEAGGDSAKGSYLQYITAKANGVTYISATFAKRPDNMPIYALRTAISKAGVEVDKLIDAVKRGGATFQEIMSKALTEAGQMIRRERDMKGVTVDWRGIEDEDVIQRHREQYDQITGLFNDIIDFQRKYVDPIVNKMNDDAAEIQGEVDHTPGTRDMGINNTPFASRTYNMVQQVLLSLKAEEGAKFAVECLKKGEKPVIAVANTNEGAVNEVVGSSEEDMEMPDLSINLKKGLQGTLRITRSDAHGNGNNEMIPFEQLSPEGQARYAEIMDTIEAASTGLSLSPIDVIRDVIKKAGYSVEELTGRTKVFDYNEDGTVKRVRRDPKKNKKRASDFNDGIVNALIINKSACTGIDLHAGIKFTNTDQRHMIIVQAQGDVNDEVQMRGRTDRTGQKQHSKYTYIVSSIPSEQRLLMMLKAKLRSLDANTTSSQKSKFNEMQVQDIINKYGDDIVIQYLAEHPDLAAKMYNPLKWTETHGDATSGELVVTNSYFLTMTTDELVNTAEKEDEAGKTASKVLGRMALLKVKEQEKMLQEIGDLYQAEIDRLNEMGENDLEITEMPLRAKTLKKDVWEEGVEPGGNNPFADNSYVEQVEMDVLKKPMKAEEVKKSQARLLSSATGSQHTGQPTWEDYKASVLKKVSDWAEQKKDETRKTFTERAEKKATAERDKYIRGAKKSQEKNGLTDEEITKNGELQYKHFYDEEMTKLDNAIKAIETQAQAFDDALNTFSTDGVYAIPTDIYNLGELSFTPSFGKVIDIKISQNFSTAASSISFATLDGRRKITIPMSGMVKQNNGEKRDIKPIIVTQTAQSRSGMFGSNVANTLKVLEQDTDNWDKLTSTATRKTGYIITGNLLKALVSLREQGLGGKLISFTTDTGEIRQGVLMGDNFEPSGLTSKAPISSAKGQLRWRGDKIVSADGNVTVMQDWGSLYSLSVPASKKKGAKYFNDETLLGLMNGQFSGKSKMRAEFEQENLDAVLKRLDEMGVTVNEETRLRVSEGGNASGETAGNRGGSAVNREKFLKNLHESVDESNNTVSLQQRFLKSRKGYEGLLDRKRRIEEAIKQEVDRQTSNPSSYKDRGQIQRLNELRSELSKIDAELGRRKLVEDNLRKKYNINKNGSIGIDDIARMFQDFNSDAAIGELFEKVYSVLKDLKIDFGFTHDMLAGEGGAAYTFVNITEYGWDEFTRSKSDQERANILLHELIHNATSHILTIYNSVILRPLLSKNQRAFAREMNAIYSAVKKANPKQADGKTFYGLKSVHEMVAELSNPDFREALNGIKYDKRTLWEKIVDLFRGLYSAKEENALVGAERALNDALENFDPKHYDAVHNAVERFYNAIIPILDGTESIFELFKNSYIVEDEAEIERLNSEPVGKGYRTVVQNPDGTFGSPMANRLGGKAGEQSKATSPYKMNQWERSEENPQLATDDGKITLLKPGKFGEVRGVDYNPYIHIRENKLNKQFKNAWERPELVYIEVVYPESEMKGGYRAEKAAKPVGRHKWPGGDLILSRWDKPVRIVPWEEVADDWVKEFKKKGVNFDIVSPHLLPILAERGVKILPPHKNMGEKCNSTYEAFKRGEYNGIRLRNGNSPVTESQGTAKLREHIASLGEKLGAKVVFHDDVSDITSRRVRDSINAGVTVAGWYDIKDGSVHFYMPHVKNRYEAERTVMHEIAGHKGMRNLLGERGYKEFMKRIWLDNSKEMEPMHEWVREHLAEYGFDLYETIDEWFAYKVAEGGSAWTMWDKVKKFLSDVLSKLGFATTPTITDMKEMLWLSKNALREGDAWNDMRRAALLHRLGLENRRYADEIYNGETRASNGQFPNSAYGDVVKAIYENGLMRGLYAWTEAHQDYMASAKLLMKAIAGGRKVKDKFNFYMKENQVDSIIQKANEQHVRDFVEPFVKAVAKCQAVLGGAKQSTFDAIEDYMAKKHGLERNREFYVRDWLDRERRRADSMPDGQDKTDLLDKIERIESEWADRKYDLKAWLDGGTAPAWLPIGPSMPSLNAYFFYLDEYIRQEIDRDYNAGENDYSGLTSYNPDANGGYDDDTVIADVEDMEASLGEDNVSELWSQKNRMTQFAIDTEYAAGLITESNRDKVSGMFNWYMPLRKWDEDTAEDVWSYMTSKKSTYLGSTLQKAKGRKSRAERPIGTMLAMGSNAITRGARNEMKKSFAGFVREYTRPGENNLVTEMQPWVENIGTDTDPVWIYSFPDIPEDASETEIEAATQAWKQRMENLAQNGLAMRVNQKDSIKYRFENKRKSRPEHVVEVWEDGKPHFFIVNGNPRAAQAINGQLKPEDKRKNIAAARNLMSRLYTSWSPTFTARNAMRDFQFSSAMLSVKEGWGYSLKFMKNYAKITHFVGRKPMMFTLFNKFRNGTLDENNRMERLFKEFAENGGITGYVMENNSEKWEKKLLAETKDLLGKKWVRVTPRLLKVIGETLEHIGESVENSARFATYVTSRNEGRTITKSVNDAKEVSVNFNRKGAGAKTETLKGMDGKVTTNTKIAAATAQYLRTNMLFYNAGMQAVVNALGNAKNHPVRFATRFAGPALALGVLTPVISAFIQSMVDDDDDKEKYGEDPYANLPSYTRRNNMCIYLGHGKFLTIPLSVEHRAFFGLGDIMAGVTFSEDLKDTKTPPALDALKQLTAFSPVDYTSNETGIKGLGGWAVGMVMPAYIAPLENAYANTTWTGAKIQDEDEFKNTNLPEYQKATSYTNSAMVDASKRWHELWGGDEATRAGHLDDSKIKEWVGEVSPAKLDYVVGQYAGEPGKLGSNVKDIWQMIWGDKEADVRKIPVVKAFLNMPNAENTWRHTNDLYWKYMDEFKETQQDDKAYRDRMDDDGEFTSPLLKLNYEQRFQKTRRYKQWKIYKGEDGDNYESEIKKLSKQIKNEKDPEELKRLKNERNAKVAELVDKLQQYEER